MEHKHSSTMRAVLIVAVLSGALAFIAGNALPRSALGTSLNAALVPPAQTPQAFLPLVARPPVEEGPSITIYDLEGNERDWEWLVGHYGPLVLHPANPGPGWRVVALRERAGTSTLTVHHEWEGQPVPGIESCFYWPSAPKDPGAGPANGLPEGMIPNRAVVGITDASGNVGPGMGDGAYYLPPDIGPHAVWVRGVNTNSDVVFGLGMIAGTEDNHLDVDYEWTDGEGPPPWYHSLVVTTVGNGQVTPDPPGLVYPPGTTVTLTAIAADGWRFDSWSGDLGGSQNPAALTMDADKSVLAVFVEEGGPPPTGLRIYDLDGTERDWNWLVATFGAVTLGRGTGIASVTELRAVEGPATLVIYVLDSGGDPIENVPVIFYWPDAPPLPPGQQFCGLDRGEVGYTKSTGEVGFGMGGGAYYFPPAGGPHVVWVAVQGTDCLGGLGMLGGTNHIHLDSVWRLP